VDPFYPLIGLLLMAFGLLGVGVAEPTLLGGHLLRVGLALLAMALGALLPPRLLLRHALGLHLFTLLLLLLVLAFGEGPGGCGAGSTWARWPSSPRSWPS
jgi:cell division protein FtsW